MIAEFPIARRLAKKVAVASAKYKRAGLHYNLLPAPENGTAHSRALDDPSMEFDFYPLYHDVSLNENQVEEVKYTHADVLKAVKTAAKRIQCEFEKVLEKIKNNNLAKNSILLFNLMRITMRWWR